MKTVVFTPYIEDVARRLAKSGILSLFAPDAAFPVKAVILDNEWRRPRLMAENTRGNKSEATSWMQQPYWRIIHLAQEKLAWWVFCFGGLFNATPSSLRCPDTIQAGGALLRHTKPNPTRQNKSAITAALCSDVDKRVNDSCQITKKSTQSQKGSITPPMF